MTVQPISINYHLYKPCNAHCRFCFATFRDVQGCLSLTDARRLLAILREAGGQKLNFAGGEPTLYPHIGELVVYAKELGFTTSMVTNGARLDALLDEHHTALDWVGLSVDSGREDVQQALGRGRGNHVVQTIALADRARSLGVRVKLNTVVTALTWQEDMSELVRQMQPERWKAFQVLPVRGQNDGSVEDLLISGKQFAAFLAQHNHLAAEGFRPIAEDNDAMRGSYLMIDPLGRFFDNIGGIHRYSQPILDVGIDQALRQVGFSPEKFRMRGGLYDW